MLDMCYDRRLNPSSIKISYAKSAISYDKNSNSNISYNDMCTSIHINLGQALT